MHTPFLITQGWLIIQLESCDITIMTHEKNKNRYKIQIPSFLHSLEKTGLNCFLRLSFICSFILMTDGRSRNRSKAQRLFHDLRSFRPSLEVDIIMLF